MAWSKRVSCGKSSTLPPWRRTSASVSRTKTRRRSPGLHPQHGARRQTRCFVPTRSKNWFNAGLRIIGPAHYGVSPYAHALPPPRRWPLPEEGLALLREMARVGMILDVTHLADKSFDEALDLYGGPVLASHHNNRTLVPNQRQLTDEQTKRLIERKAVIGIALDTWMLYPNWVRGVTKAEVTGCSRRMVDHIDRASASSPATPRHVGIGHRSRRSVTAASSRRADLDTIADLQGVPEDAAPPRLPGGSDVAGIMQRQLDSVSFKKGSLEPLLARKCEERTAKYEGGSSMGDGIQKVVFAPEHLPSCRSSHCSSPMLLAHYLRMMMIDGELAFLDERSARIWRACVGARRREWSPCAARTIFDRRHWRS